MDFSKLKVLIVDDISTVRTVLTKTLKGLKIEQIEACDNISDAWQNILIAQEKGAKFDVILSDWNMPGGDGIELLQKIRAHSTPEIRFLKFIMITGANDKVIQAMDEGAHNIIHKPFTADDFKNKFELMFTHL